MGNEMIPNDGEIHWMTIPIIFLTSIASIKIPSNIDDPRNATKDFPVKRSWLKQLEMVQRGEWKSLYEEVSQWRTKCQIKGMHQIQTEAQIAPGKIELLAATGHLRRCVRALDSDGTIDPDIADIIAKHPGNEQITDSNMEPQHNPMDA